MKKLLLLSVFAALLAGPAFSQDSKEKDKQKDNTEWQKRVKDEVNLSDEQVAKWESLNKEFKEKMDAVAQDASLTKDMQKEKKMALKKEKETLFLQMLSPEQQARYKELIEKKKKEAEAAKPAGS